MGRGEVDRQRQSGGIGLGDNGSEEFVEGEFRRRFGGQRVPTATPFVRLTQRPEEIAADEVRVQPARFDRVRTWLGNAPIEPQEEGQFFTGVVEHNWACPAFARHHGPQAGRVQVDPHETERLLRHLHFLGQQSEHATSRFVATRFSTCQSNGTNRSRRHVEKRVGTFNFSRPPSATPRRAVADRTTAAANALGSNLGNRSRGFLHFVERCAKYTSIRG